jgi:hypothetical protein
VRAVAAAVFLVACGGSSSAPSPGSASASAASDDCTVAVTHVVDVIAAGAKPDERKAIDQIASRSIDRCRGEGLSAAQRDCILALHDIADPSPLATCAAIVAKKPGWLEIDALGLALVP